jgi:hypothetical protein
MERSEVGCAYTTHLLAGLRFQMLEDDPDMIRRAQEKDIPFDPVFFVRLPPISPPACPSYIVATFRDFLFRQRRR